MIAKIASIITPIFLTHSIAAAAAAGFFEAESQRTSEGPALNVATR